MEASRRKAMKTLEKNHGNLTEWYSELGKKSTTRTFTDPDKARAAARKRWYNEDGSRKETT